MWKTSFFFKFFLLAESGKISLSECKACRIFTETFFWIFLSLMFPVSLKKLKLHLFLFWVFFAKLRLLVQGVFLCTRGGAWDDPNYKTIALCSPKLVPYLIQWSRFASTLDIFLTPYFYKLYLHYSTFSDHLLPLKSWQKIKRWASVLCVRQTVLRSSQEWLSQVFVLLHWYLLTNPAPFNIWSFKDTFMGVS